MNEENTFCYYGTPLPALEIPEGTAPTKRHQPMRPEDQIVTDENGRRRFHGAFTGGFSAGYWNTVGSQEGWTPQSFKSSRSEKAHQQRQQKPEDFMDEEDLGEFGIGSKKVQVRPEFAQPGGTDNESNRKRKFLQPPTMGPIPGTPVLCDLLKRSEVESVAVRILRSWGWRSGRGVGPRQTLKEKQAARERNKREQYLLDRYGSDAVTHVRKPIGYDDSEEDEEDDDDGENGITYAPEDFEPLPMVNVNGYGLGYTPLSREPVLSQGITVTQKRDPRRFEVLDKNQKFSITGQAFGVGALEEDDDMDVYQHEDLSNYDFSLEEERESAQKKKPTNAHGLTTALEGFQEGKDNFILQMPVYTVEVPDDFRPRNWAERRSRFTPLPLHKARELERNLESCQIQADLTPADRGRLLEKSDDQKPGTSTKSQGNMNTERGVASREERTKDLLERITSQGSNFTRGGIITADVQDKPVLPTEVHQDTILTKEQTELLEKAKNKTRHLGSIDMSANFKPFLGDDSKQLRYEKFLAANLQRESEIADFLSTIQPVHLSPWDREMEKKEFIQARHLYKPLRGIMSERFVSETSIVAEKKEKEIELEKKENKIVMERTKSVWKPNAALCKRYNIAEPFGGALVEAKKPQRSKLSIFDYLETSVNKKSDFQTPVIIPKHIEKPKAIVRETQSSSNANVDSSTQSADKPRDSQQGPTANQPRETKSPIQTKSKTVQSRAFVARTELEKRVVETLNTPASKKLELFQAIFDNDSDEEGTPPDGLAGENVGESEAPTPNPFLATIGSFNKANTAAAANLLRNTSPPRGIFAALFTSNSDETPQTVPSTSEALSTAPHEPSSPSFKKPFEMVPQKITFKPKNERLSKEKHDEVKMEKPLDSEETYGPKMPTRPIAPLPPSALSSGGSADLEAKIVQLLAKHKQQSRAQEDEWVEKGAKKDVQSSPSIDSSDESSERGNSDGDSKKNSRRKSKKSKKPKGRAHIKKHSKKKDNKKSSKKRQISHKHKSRK